MLKLWGHICLLITLYGEAIIARSQTTEAIEVHVIDNYEPSEKYLQQWNRKFTELDEIPQCKNVPDLTAEESSIALMCPRKNKNILCSNIFLFSVVREKCAPIFNNKEQLKQSVRKIIADKGLGTVATTPFKEIFEEVKIKTGLPITNFLSRDMTDLVVEVLHESKKLTV